MSASWAVPALRAARSGRDDKEGVAGSERKAPEQLVEWAHHLRCVGGPRLQAVAPGFDVSECGTLDLHAVPAVEQRSGRDVAHGQVIAGDVGTARQEGVQLAPRLERGPQLGVVARG